MAMHETNDRLDREAYPNERLNDASGSSDGAKLLKEMQVMMSLTFNVGPADEKDSGRVAGRIR